MSAKPHHATAHVTHMNREGKMTLHKANTKVRPQCGRHDNPRALYPATDTMLPRLREIATLCPKCFPKGQCN